MRRDESLARAVSETWDFTVVGGGATGAGIAVDAAHRGYRTLLLEQHDFGKGTSSRSTKLVHGGVRYLAQGNISLVREALRERGLMRRNAPHLVHDLGFVLPVYDWVGLPFYGTGLWIYDRLSGALSFGASRILSPDATVSRLPSIRREGLRGSILYTDGQFDDARLLISLIRTASDAGASVLNYCRVTHVSRNDDFQLIVADMEKGREFQVRSKVVINATGAFSDEFRNTAESEPSRTIAFSQGSHIVLDRSFLPGSNALMVPKTTDGRVLFAIPWHDHTLVGTTDIPVERVDLEPRPSTREIEFILENASRYLAREPKREDVLATFAGIRPLVLSRPGVRTAALSREHSIRVENSGVVAIIGGKWTTYRKMAEECIDTAESANGLQHRPCATDQLAIHGSGDAAAGWHQVYGSDIEAVRQSGSDALLHPALPYTEAEVTWAARQEMARTVEDVLARRLRALFLNTRAAIASARRTAELLRAELGRDEAWARDQVDSFTRLAQGYL